MRNCGISLETNQSGSNQTGKDELTHNASNLSDCTLETCPDRQCEDDISVKSFAEQRDLEMDEVPSLPVNSSEEHKLLNASEGEFTRKRQKVSETKEVNSTRLEATVSSVVEWMNNLDEGVSGDLFMFLTTLYIYIYIYIYIYMRARARALCFVIIIVGKCVVYWFQATLNNILEHFNGSSEDSVVELLNCLECDFLIYRKGNVYRVL